MQEKINAQRYDPEKKRLYYQKNKESILLKRKQYRDKNREIINERWREQSKNRYLSDDEYRTRRLFNVDSRRRNVRSTMTMKSSDLAKAFLEVLKDYENKCAYCPDGKYEAIDHFIPLVRGGTHTIDNLRPSCKKCNLSKGSKLFNEWKEDS